MKKVLKIIFYILLLTAITIYAGIVFLLPKLINSKTTISKLQSAIYNKTKTKTNIQKLNLKISPTLVFNLNIGSIDAKYNNSDVLNIKDLSLNYRLLQNDLLFIKAENIYINGNNIKEFPKPTKKENNNKLQIKKIPKTNIKKLTYESNDLSVYLKNIDTNDEFVKLYADIKAPYIKGILKVGNSGSLKLTENKLSANQFKVELENSQIYIDGILLNNNKKSDFNIKGGNLPVSELMPILLHFQKSQDPAKKFIENFKNFTGSVDIDLKFKDNKISGKCTTNNIGAKLVWYNIPLYFKKADFNFDGSSVTSKAEGILGNEKVIHTLNITDLGTEKKEVTGTINTTLTKKFNYVPNLTILNSVNAGLMYKIKSKKVDVFYNIDITKDSDLIYNSSYLGLRDYKRKIYAHTYKDNDNLYLKDYKYSYFDSDKENIVVTGDGLFIKINDKYTPQYLTCHTNGYAPVSVTGSFGEKIKGGKFSGNLKYDYIKDKITGVFDIKDARYKAFKIEKARVDAKNEIVNITTEGLFKGEKYSAAMTTQNDFSDSVLIYDMKLFLDKLILETKPKTHKKIKKIDPKDFTKKVHEADITVNNWEIIINKIQREGFIFENVNLLGSMKNSIFDFKMKELNFADGIVNANGIYNFANNSSNMTFIAKNINSNKAANMMLNLQNQVEGTANAKVSLKAKNMFRFIDAHCDFEIKEGFLPKLGDSEFMLKNSKYKLSEIVNFDLSEKEAMQSDIKGSFDVHNNELNNIGITSWHMLSSMFLKGSYEMEKQYANLQLFWKYSKEAPKGVKIFYVPLSLILKIAFRPENSKEIYKSDLLKVPDINASEKNTSYYRMQLDGNINSNKINLILKEIR